MIRYGTDSNQASRAYNLWKPGTLSGHVDPTVPLLPLLSDIRYPVPPQVIRTTRPRIIRRPSSTQLLGKPKVTGIPPPPVFPHATTVKLVKRHGRYRFKGKTKQIGTWGTGTRKPPVRGPITLLAPKRRLIKGKITRVEPFGVRKLRVRPVLVKLVRRPKQPLFRSDFIKPRVTPAVVDSIYPRDILAKLVQRGRRYSFTGKVKQLGAWGQPTTRRKPLLFKLLLAEQRRAVRGDVQLRKPQRLVVIVPPPVRPVRTVAVRRPDRYSFKGKVKYIVGWGGVPPTPPTYPRPILTLLAPRSARYGKKTRKQVLSDHLVSLTGRPPIRPANTNLSQRTRQHTVNRGHVTLVKRFGRPTARPPVRPVRMVKQITRRRELPQTRTTLGKVVRTFGVTNTPTDVPDVWHGRRRPDDRRRKAWPLPPPHFPVETPAQELLEFGTAPATEFTPSWVQIKKSKPRGFYRGIVAPLSTEPAYQEYIAPVIPTQDRADRVLSVDQSIEPARQRRVIRNRHEEDLIMALLMRGEL